MCNYLMNRRMRMLLVTIAVSLSSVTALSVGMAMSALIQDPLLALVFAAAAVMLDLYKYIAWPIAMGLLENQKRAYACLMIASALILSSVSAWATYDRLLSSIMGGQARHAVAQQQIAELQKMKAEEARQLAVLDGEMKSIGQQAQQLRERGIVTKAQDLEEAASSRISGQRVQALQRLDRLADDISLLQIQTLSVVNLPLLLVVLLCSGFAVALEIVPALIGCALRTSFADAVAEVKAAQSVEQQRETVRTVRETSVKGVETGQQQDLFGAADGDLMHRLLEKIKATASGTPIPVREFAATLRVGNRRVIKLFQSAIDLGAMRKTTAGYVAA